MNTPRSMAIKQIKKKHEHNQMMIDLAYSLSYAKFDGVKECSNVEENVG